MKKEFRDALITYVREQYRKPYNPYTAEQWVSVMNSYARKEDVSVCSRKADIRPAEAQIFYCRLAIAMSEYALRAARLTAC